MSNSLSCSSRRNTIQQSRLSIHQPRKSGKRFETIWITALEGGCNHWLDYIHTNQNDLKCGRTVVDKNFDIVIHHGSEGWGEPLEEDETVEYVKAFDVIVDGINLLDPERQRMALTVSELGQLDANDCDYIIQLGVFGKEVYC